MQFVGYIICIIGALLIMFSPSSTASTKHIQNSHDAVSIQMLGSIFAIICSLSIAAVIVITRAINIHTKAKVSSVLLYLIFTIY